MNAELLHQQFQEAKESAQQWAHKVYQDSFTGEKWQFSTEDLLTFEKLKEFDLNKAWQSVTKDKFGGQSFDRQAVAQLVELAATSIHSMGVMFFLLIFFALCIIVRKWQTKHIKFYFQPAFTVWNELLAETKLNTMRYQPSFFTLTSELQIFWFPWVELWQKATDKLKYTREIFSLSDGGEVALDWVNNTNSAKEIRDIVVVVPGLSGASDQLYCREIAKACMASNLDCVVVNYRGLANVPLKTAKIYNAAVNDDLEEAVEYIFQDHCFDDQGNQVRRLTAVGISLGASVLANFAARLGTRNRLDAHFGLCCHFEWKSSFDFLKQRFFGFFDYALGYGMLVTLRESYAQFDQLAQKKFPERQVGHLIAHAKTLTTDFALIASISGGFTVEEYLEKSDVTSILHKIA